MMKTRRDVIKWTGAAAASQLLGACASWDRLFTGDSSDDRDKVIILGAGLAGLGAALELKKSGIPYRIYEGSGRIGGRAYSLENWDTKFHALELGGEWIAANHGSILGLARELRVAVQESRFVSPMSYDLVDGFVKSDRFADEWKSLQRNFLRINNEIYGKSGEKLNFLNQYQFPKAVQLDLVSAAELISRIESQLTSLQKQFLERISGMVWGAGLYQLSSLHLIHWFQTSDLQSTQYRISGGTGNLVNSLYARISGVIPEKYVKLNHRLKDVRKYSEGIQLVFETEYGQQEILGKSVICTLPLPQLRKVNGLGELGFSERMLNTIRNSGMGTHSKFALGYEERHWQKIKELKQSQFWLNSTDTQVLWEASRPPSLDLQQVKGVIAGMVGGEAGLQGGPHLIDRAKKNLVRMLNSSVPEERSYVFNWAKHKWSEGSVAYNKPGQFAIREKMQNQDQSWILAGEHASQQFPGTMNGALESGTAAAQIAKNKIKK